MSSMMLPVKYKFILMGGLAGLSVVFGMIWLSDVAWSVILNRENLNIKNSMSASVKELEKEVENFREEVQIISRLPSVTSFIDYHSLIKDSESLESDTQETYIYYKDIAEQTFLDFATENEDFLEIRYIDSSGMEVIKIERDNRYGQAEIKTASELEYKGERYYYLNSIDLSPGKVYVSPIDLNVDRGEVVEPYEPNIRFATPVYDQSGQNHGIVIINLYADRFIDYIRGTTFDDLYLIDQDGYFLYNLEHPEREWGRELEHGSTFFLFDGEMGNYFGHFRVNNNLIIEEKAEKDVYHLHKISYTSISSDLYWIFVTEHKEEGLMAPYISVGKQILLRMILLSGLIFAIYSVFIFWFTRSLKSIKQAIKQIDSGDYDVNIPVISRDELGDMAILLNDLSKKIREKDREQYEFISSASHQLRTPVSIIGQNTDLLREKISKLPRPKPLLEQINDIESGNRQIANLIGDLMKFTELGSDYFANDVNKIKARVLVEEVLTSFGSVIKKKRLKVELKIPDNFLVKADESRLKLVFINIICNAIDYSNPGGTIVIKAQRKEAHVLFCVTDQGIGIADEDKVHLFEKFYRAKNAYKNKNVGTGLGLVLAKQVVEGHGGKIWIESKLDKGTKVYFTIFNY